MEILYRDDNLTVCVKPIGADSEKDMPALLEKELRGSFYPVHRLDMNVSGLMVYARNKKTASALSQAIQQGKMIKEYLALVHGNPPAEDSWEDLLFKDSRRNKVFVVTKMRKGVKEASLSYRNLAAGEQSLVQILLHTGRSHQIRVQFSSRGYPLIGDHKYGSRSQEKMPLLYSCRLTFPYKNQNVSFEKIPKWANHMGISELIGWNEK